MDSQQAGQQVKRALGRVRSKKVAALRRRVESGRYYVKSTLLARALFLAR